ncbi:hypothetical protein Tco_0906543 [Tanacetum coccineum]|uniref:Uncharacterized protein n=1 Tax=Tanacetum coccineum TaxID=301880 RepID=A0ABQ5CJ36_9ASTR
MLVSTSIIFPSANSTEYLVSTVDGTMLLKGLILAEVRLLSTRFHVLVIISSFALTSGPLEVLSIRESHDSRDSISLKVKVLASFYLPNTVRMVQIWTITLVMSWLSTLLIVIALHSARSSGAQLTFVVERLVPSCCVIFDLEPLSLSFNFVFTSEIFKSLSFSLDRLCHLAILCLDQHAHTLHLLESSLIIFPQDWFLRRDLLISEFAEFENEHVGFAAALAILVTGASQSRQHEEPFEEMGSEAIEVPALKDEEFAQIIVLGLCVSFPNGEALSLFVGGVSLAV